VARCILVAVSASTFILSTHSLIRKDFDAAAGCQESYSWEFWKARPDVTGKLGFTSYQECSVAIRMLVYGVAGDLMDEYSRMSESTCRESMYKFCRAVIAVFGTVYLREPLLRTLLGWCRSRRKENFRDDRKYWLHALGVEELPVFMARLV
jgi:hypothetical protein